MIFAYQLDLRYEGQEFTITVPVSEEEIRGGQARAIRQRFDDTHDRSFGHAAPDEPIEVVSARASARGQRPKVTMPQAPAGGQAAPSGVRRMCLTDPANFVDCQVYQRSSLPGGAVIAGPAVVEEYASTTVLFEDDVAEVAPTGELIIRVRGGRS